MVTKLSCIYKIYIVDIEKEREVVIMKRILSLALVLCMVLSTFPMAFAIVTGGTCAVCGNPTNKLCSICGVDYSCGICGYCNTCGTIAYGNGTDVKYNAALDTTIGDLNGDGVPDNQEYYTVTVPARLTPSENKNSGDVVAAGTWASNRKLLVAADTSVRLINDLNSTNYQDLNVYFDTMEIIGSNTSPISETKNISVELMPETALFGTWSGVFYYNVEMVNSFAVKLGEPYVVVGARIPSQSPYGSWIIFNEDGSSSGYYETAPGTYGYVENIIYNGSIDNVHFVILEDGTMVDRADDPWVWYTPMSQLPLQEVRFYSEDGLIDETVFIPKGIKAGGWIESSHNTIDAIYEADWPRDLVFFDEYKCQYDVNAYGYPMYIDYQYVFGTETEYLLLHME